MLLKSKCIGNDGIIQTRRLVVDIRDFLGDRKV